MSEADRQALAAGQQALLAALAGGPVPPGFDAGRLALAGRTLLNKRRRSLERQWPALAAVPDFAGRFAAYARRHPLPAGGAADDVRAFHRYLRTTGGLTDDARSAWVIVAAARRCVAVGRLARRGRFVIAVRVPWWGVRTIRV